ncbi:hypothetical protein ACF3NS_15240 [Arsenicicoccus cauae]|uniref:hypothetical protein n=1 Tax=Arsenicicoccus cauae TaxID=2663847 RepID=UPI00370DC0AD
MVVLVREDDPSTYRVQRRFREAVVGFYSATDGSDVPAVAIPQRDARVRLTPFRPVHVQGPDVSLGPVHLVGAWTRATVRRCVPVGGPDLVGDDLDRLVRTAAAVGVQP